MCKNVMCKNVKKLLLFSFFLILTNCGSSNPAQKPEQVPTTAPDQLPPVASTTLKSFPVPAQLAATYEEVFTKTKACVEKYFPTLPNSETPNLLLNNGTFLILADNRQVYGYTSWDEKTVYVSTITIPNFVNPSYTYSHELIHWFTKLGNEAHSFPVFTDCEFSRS